MLFSSNFQTLLKHRTGDFFVLVESVGIDVQRCGGLGVAQEPSYRGHIRSAGNQEAGCAVMDRVECEFFR